MAEENEIQEEQSGEVGSAVVEESEEDSENQENLSPENNEASELDTEE